MLYALDLFSGIAGNTLGLRGYTKTIAYCEADKHAQAVLLSRMADGSIEPAPICTDVTKLDGRELKGLVDIIVGGFPCQDISSAGKGAGLEGQRSGLFYEIVRLAKEIQPAFLFLENVSNIRTRGLDTVVQELTEAGYDCRWAMLSAAAVGSPQKRDRWFLLAYADNRDRLQSGSLSGTYGTQNRPQKSGKNSAYEFGDAIGWAAEPNVVRVVNGLPLRLDRIKRLGNAVVPQQARKAFEILIGI